MFRCHGCKDKTKAGPKCDEPCPTNCKSTCQQNRRCHECKDYYYGDICDKACSNCKNGCDRSSGDCVGGCNTGFWGVRCDQLCSPNCVLNSVVGVCKQSDGSCDRCVQGYWGSQCDWTCYSTCRLNGRTGTACFQSIGGCDYCTAGWWGNTCQNRCSDQCTTDTCNKADGGCTCKPGYKPNTCVNGR